MHWMRQFESNGFAQLPNVFAASATRTLADELVAALEGAGASALRAEDGTLYAGRNILQCWPRCATVWRTSVLIEAVGAILGPCGGLVRALYFDKPPGQTWALPLHKDLTIAVRNNRLRSAVIGKPTRKAGVPHVEAPEDVLSTMLTVRIHLDDVTDANGPLKVIPGSHLTGKALHFESASPVTLHAQAGDVLLMRPLLAHCSGKSVENTTLHRRILHLEFAASPHLPDGYEFYDFVPL